MAELEEQRQVRIQKIQTLRAMGIDPFPENSQRTHHCAEIMEHGSMDAIYTVSGRIRAMRAHGKSMFIDIEDESGVLQIFFSSSEIGEELFKILDYIDLGDFIEATGSLFITKTEQKSLRAQTFRILAKAIRPIPDEWFGLKDEETMLRKRYIDLIVNRDTRHRFQKRSVMISQIRNFLELQGSMEVETAMFEHIPGGADAEPFVTHHNTLDIDLYLRISLELQLKRLIVGGYEKIHEIGRVFRNEGMSTQHLQEFTMLEFYWAYHNLDDLIRVVPQMYQQVFEHTFCSLQREYRGTMIDYSGVWPVQDYQEMFLHYAGINLDKYPEKETLLEQVKKMNLKELDESGGRGRLIDQVYKKLVRPHLIQPTILINYPLDLSPLAKKRYNHNTTVHRMQVIIAGIEVGNGFAELNDPLDQRERLEEQQRLRDQGDSEAQRLDEDFIEALEYGMPPTAGFGVGIDRLFMLGSGVESVRDVVFFPNMRLKN